MQRKNWQGAIISILFAELVGLLSSLFSGNARGLYMEYVKPPLSPPGWVFGVVWPILYALMGLAAYLVYKSNADKELKSKALLLYGIQLFFNFMWSIVFFRFGSALGALVVIIILDLLVMATIWLFSKINKTAAYLMIPYLLWILFATYLNIGIVLLN